MAEPAIGRIGYVFSGNGGTTAEGGREFWCAGCKSWQSQGPACPNCGRERSGFNKWLRHAQLDSHLNAMAAEQHQQKRMVTREQLRGR